MDPQGSVIRGGIDMKLILAIVSAEDAEVLTEALLRDGFRVTALSAMGGFLRRTYVTLLIGTEADRVESALQLIRGNTARRPARFPLFARRDAVEIGAATVFVLDLEASRRY
jgi:uncharacterized protein YaaQ